MSELLYPYVMRPKETPAIWGGDALLSRYGKREAARIAHVEPPLGESWECWDENAVGNGALAGTTLAALRTELGTRLTGPIDAERLFPVLTKIIDARAPLSVQVHPDDAYAQRVEGQPFGKTECWYILACEPGAELVLGWARDTSREEYERRVADGSLGEILRRVPVYPGDAFYLPAGTLHAIGAGIQLFETQQASDLTYRIFDWNRVGADGRPRQLHVEKAGDVLDFRATFPGAVQQLAYDADGIARTLLIADPRFAVERVKVHGLDAYLETDGRPLTITAMDAHVRVDAGGGSTVLEPWQTAVTPAAAARIALIPGGEPTHALVVRPQPDLAAMRARTLGAGVAPDAFDAFAAQFAQR
ncbi:mannose-6-phosphate isomerase [Vulcanimicrobium alpinum]|uniref:Mannose-6-phosphate isomerase n=1 Tax=Vulcanimicrobium alpinum TaxID=3016050 RepID=A0AAN2CA37_UNVUL|nr:type I phosphomannose isomerase catalytic subunit [Vulcanimicrobium alpinum]BDE07230.1 mannose-6-phosphate isomerase [Vulcanimicrobium alpinum]